VALLDLRAAALGVNPGGRESPGKGRQALIADPETTRSGHQVFRRQAGEVGYRVPANATQKRSHHKKATVPAAKAKEAK